MRKLIKISVSLILVILFCASALATGIPERPRNYIVDLAGVVDDRAEPKLNAFLRELEQKTTAQVIVLTVATTEGVPIEDFSLQIAEKWKLGRKDRDNGLLLTFAIKDRRYRFEVGYGLEGLLPDSLVGSIGRDVIVPYFKQGQYTSGIAVTVQEVAKIIAQDAGVKVEGIPYASSTRSARRAQKEVGIGSVIIFVLMAIFFLYMLIRHPRILFMWIMFSALGGRRGFGGGGFGGGGGGFGGGMGGGFGGGGASGGW